jgi:cell division protein FtsA
MDKKMRNTKIAAIDIGTSKICTLIGAVDGSSGLRILGMGIAPSRGMEKGLVADVAGVEESILQSVKSAEIMADCKLESAYISLSGRHISSSNSQGTVAITHKNQVVHPDALVRALNIALDAKVPEARKLLQVVPRAYTLDGHKVQEPVGLQGYELNVEVHFVTAAVANVKNLTKCIMGAGIKINDLIPGSWASAEAVLNEEEKQSGILVADIGSGSTDIAIMKNGSIYYTSVLPVGGNRITQDITAGLGLSFDVAEEMKKEYGCITLPEGKNDVDITVDKNGRIVSHQKLCHIIRARTAELVHLILFELLVFELPRSEYAKLIPSGIVITGGCANLPGIIELVQGITNLPVRIGRPPTLPDISGSKLSDPAYATSVGLLLWPLKRLGTQKWWSQSSGIRAFTT